jgi:peptidoglycan/LPS O-acetylase OafA/YrhL
MSEPTTTQTSMPESVPALAKDEGGTGHIPVLDGMRGLAILLVLMVHQFNSVPKEAPLLWWSRQSNKLWIGVDLFFVLSGLLITRGLIATREKPHYFRNFYAKRALRIFPLYFFWMAIITVVEFYMHGGKGAAMVWPWWPYLGNFWVGFRNEYYDRALMPGVNHFWSLCVEEHFYLIWPLVILYARPKHFWWVANAILVIPVIRGFIQNEMGNTAAYVLTPGRLDSLMIGGCITLAIERFGFEKIHLLAKFCTPLAIFGWYQIYDDLDAYSPWMAQSGYTVVAFLFAHLIVMVLGSQGTLKIIFEQRWLQWLGKYSYGLYVIHGVLITWFFDILVREKVYALVGNPYLQLLVYVVACQGTYMIMAHASYHWFEKWFLRLKKRFQAS